jgi:arylsulfatase A-like enzyme
MIISDVTTTVSGQSSKRKILKTRGYATGMVGKWHQVPVNAMDRLADFQVLAKSHNRPEHHENRINRQPDARVY